MREYLPIISIGGVIGIFAIIFTVAYLSIKDKKEAIGFDRNMKDSEIMKRLLIYAKPYWKSFAAVLILVLFSIASDVISPLMVGYIQDMIKTDFALKDLFVLVGVYAAILVFSMVSMYVQAIVLQKTGQKIPRENKIHRYVHHCL